MNHVQFMHNEAMLHKVSHGKSCQKVLEGNHPQIRYYSCLQLCGDSLCTRYHHSQLFHFPKSRNFTTCHKNYMLYPLFITLILTILLTSIEFSLGYPVCESIVWWCLKHQIVWLKFSIELNFRISKPSSFFHPDPA